jgi:hypothetical protein
VALLESCNKYIVLFMLIEPLGKLHCNTTLELLLIVEGEKSIDI